MPVFDVTTSVSEWIRVRWSTMPGHEPRDFDPKAGEGAFPPAQAHTAENIGDSRIRLIVYELKPAMKMKG